LTLDLIRRIEDVERSRLITLGLLSDQDADKRIDLAAIESKLRKWKPKRRSDHQAAVRSLFTLAELGNVQGHLNLGRENARLAALAALRAGLLASESVARDLLTQMRSRGGTSRNRDEEEENAAAIRAELRDAFDRGEASRIARITKLAPSTVRRHLNKIRKRAQLS